MNDDPQRVTIADIEAMIASLGYGTVEYHDAMAHYLMTMARAQWRLSDLARHRDRASRKRVSR